MVARRIAVLALLVTLSASQAVRGATWESDWATALDRARAEKKMVLVDFSAAWCKPCQYMEKEVLPHPDIERRLADFVLLRLNYDKASQARKYGIRSIPAFLFIDPAERVRLLIVGGTTVDKFAARLDPMRIVARDALRGSLMIGDPATEAEGHLVIGRSYVRVGDFRLASGEFRAAERLAERGGNARILELARIDRTVADGLAGSRKKLLAKLQTAQPGESSSGRAYRLLMSGRLLTEMNDLAAAGIAFGEALAAATDDPELRRDAELALEIAAKRR
jgi:thioredoxin-like negative regulator of GroEL